ncbi:DUF1501 domain-containing protein [Singulisphaera acidiphila]|uniref:DUF1501 domain-containing protein n=1 Tax=Singulisphaera acidiphila (strain ATCC BAA-1392 / DSM 18658 / VKM B-2454 / MOB10) TaxID=886293 RepID=L0DNR7_SINAD|nr:DUF1501 domain-containing protein [Singulisphaera acidiphila]AGA31019.1 Protein of unknown function (DUF1501) [Singulisphaera acidiphila DSM 18658]
MSDNTFAVSSRRHFLASQSMGIGSLALTWLLNQEGALAAPAKPSLERPVYDLTPKTPPAPPRARAMISLFMQGGPSHLDLFDPKPELTKRNGNSFTGDIKYDNAGQASAKLLGSPWKFRRHGQCGMELSELLPGLGEVADEITLVRSMQTGVNNHGQSINALNNGRIATGRPVLGSWLTYALGTEGQNLPAYCVLTDPGGLPVIGVDNWTGGWLPSLYQGTVIRPTEPRIPNLDPPPHLVGKVQRRYLDYLDRFNRDHLEARPGEQDLAARIASYELAARMQTAAKEALDISGESAATQTLYGLDDPESREFGTRCLIARRLVERGVRFVQVCTGNQNWDHHGGILKQLPAMCHKVDRPSAALVRDLQQRGLLDSTVVSWGGEMGRLPVVQNEKNVGRDHNTYGFSMWLAGGGFKAGHVHGSTDELGHKAVDDVVTHSDYHATLLSLFGLDHKTLVFKRPNGDGSLVDGQPAQVVQGLLA